MDKMIESVIIAVAALCAAAILIVATKTFKQEKIRKIGFFTGTILGVTGIIGSLFLLGQEKQSAPDAIDPANKKIEQIKTAEPVGPGIDLAETAAKMGRIDALRSTKEWQSFVALWRELNDSLAQESVTVNSDRYQNTLDKIKSTMKALRGMAGHEAVIKDTEIDLLENVCNGIAKNTSPNRNIVTRMAIPTINEFGYESQAMGKIRERLLTLAELKQKKAIDSEEFRQALEILKENIKIYSLIEAMPSEEGFVMNGGLLGYYTGKTEDAGQKEAKQYIKNMETDYLAHLKMEAIEKVQSAYPDVDDLIDDMESK